MNKEDTHSDLIATGDGILDWGALAPRVLYPTKVLIIEAIRMIGQPVSANELERAFDGAFSLSALSYHIKTLADLNILALYRKRQVRGAWEKFYFFTPDVICDVDAG
jgi:DNA-binding transcriptional ArsR family regulator